MKIEPPNPAKKQEPDGGSSIPGQASIEEADIVISLNGRDGGKRFLVVGTNEASYSFLADGKGRRIEKPKLKKNRHLKLEEKAYGPIADKFKNGEKVTNSEIRRALAQYELSHAREGGDM